MPPRCARGRSSVPSPTPSAARGHALIKIKIIYLEIVLMVLLRL
ncbi:MAG TPA: hypothetical protein P5215_00515 [Bacteroidales bacterium]|nr:hypothetical protein [Bacteroidales bacterium]HRR03744.1 hypothetical protein [Bacteroidales bacterium]